MKHDFKFISKHSPQVKSAYSALMEILSLVHNDLRKQYTFQHESVGSYSRNMITYDAKSNIGFDFDINIYPNDEENRFTAKQIKNYCSSNHYCLILVTQFLNIFGLTLIFSAEKLV